MVLTMLKRMMAARNDIEGPERLGMTRDSQIHIRRYTTIVGGQIAYVLRIRDVRGTESERVDEEY